MGKLLDELRGRMMTGVLNMYIHCVLNTYIHACMSTYIGIYWMRMWCRTTRCVFNIYTYLYLHTWSQGCSKPYVHTYIHIYIYTYRERIMFIAHLKPLQPNIQVLVFSQNQTMRTYIHGYIHKCIQKLVVSLSQTIHTYIHTGARLLAESVPINTNRALTWNQPHSGTIFWIQPGLLPFRRFQVIKKPTDGHRYV